MKAIKNKIFTEGGSTKEARETSNRFKDKAINSCDIRVNEKYKTEDQNRLMQSNWQGIYTIPKRSSHD